ncbi:hypothetical protein AB0E67_10320 [Streptomyces sp. NPDC032161]
MDVLNTSNQLAKFQNRTDHLIDRVAEQSDHNCWLATIEDSCF